MQAATCVTIAWSSMAALWPYVLNMCVADILLPLKYDVHT